VVLYGCETWSLTLREEHRLRVIENRVLGSLSGVERCPMKLNIIALKLGSFQMDPEIKMVILS
jgi:hypothetical protein